MRQYFVQIAAGTKRTEYRSRAAYRARRLEGVRYNVIQLRNAYATNVPEMLVEFLGVRNYGKGRGSYYAIRLGRILKIKRWQV